MKTIAITVAVCLAAGLLLGYALFGNGQRLTGSGQGERSLRLHPEDPHESADSEALVASLQKQIEHLMQENRSLRSRIPAAPSLPVDATKISIPKKLIPQLNLEAIGEDYGIGQEVIDVLQMTEVEKKRVENAIGEARAKLDQLEIHRRTVVSQTAESVELSVPPFGQEGAAVRSKLEGDIRAALGDERSGFFLQFAGSRMDERFNHFGQASQKVKLTREDNGRLRVETNFKIETPNGTSSGGRSQSYKKDTFPPNYQHLFDVQ